MDDNHEKNANTMVMELEMAEENEEEESNVIEKNTSCEVALKRLRKLPSPRVTKSRILTKSTCMEQFLLLEKNNIKRLKDSPQDDLDCHAHQCAHCDKTLSFPWKTKGTLHDKPIPGIGSCHTIHAQRRLMNYCNPDGRSSIAQRIEEKIKIKEENEVAVTMKAEKYQEELDSGRKSEREKRTPNKD